MYIVYYFACLVVVVSKDIKTNPLIAPPEYNTSFILRSFVELQNQWCPSWRHKRMFILNYNPEPFSEDILTEILKLNEPPKIISSEYSGLVYWLYENRRCGVVMVRGYERMTQPNRIFFGGRYIFFHPKLQDNTFMNALNSGVAYLLDKAYHIVYNQTAIEIHHKNFFTNETIRLDPLNIRVPDDLKNLWGRKLRMTVPEGNYDVTTFDRYMGQTIARQRNATFEVVEGIDVNTDYGVVNVGLPFLGTDKMLALGSTFISVLVPRSKPKPIIAVLVDPFDYYSWIALFVMIFTMALVLSMFGKLLSKLNPFQVALELVMCILGGPSRSYGGWFENQLITNYCLLSIVLVSSYQSLIISYLSFVRYYPEINSNEEIRNKCIFPDETPFASHLNLRTHDEDDGAGYEHCYLFSSRDNPWITSLLIANMRETDYSAKMAYEENLRIADTIYYKFHLLYYFFNKSLIRELFPFYVHAFYESGLFNQYYKNKSNSIMNLKQEIFLNRTFAVADLSIVWYLYLGGMIASFLWFLLEVVIFQCRRLARTLKARWKKCTIRTPFARRVNCWRLRTNK